jgi:Rrf2 family iron-sulfur cluster assembly transcriptional regulator
VRLGKAAAYAVFAAVHIAERGKEGPISGDQIAAACNISFNHLMKLLQRMVRARILHSERGPHGGFRLLKPPSKVTVLDVIEAVDGPVDGDATLGSEVRGKGRAKQIIRSQCNDVAKYTRSVLSKTSLNDLIG